MSNQAKQSSLPRIGILSTHPIQYYTPLYRALAQVVDLQVFYCHQQASSDHARTEFGVAFEWDVPLLGNYQHQFLSNRAARPDVSHFAGCDTPEIVSIIRRAHFDAFIVHGWYVKSYLQAMLACWQTGTPLLVRGDSHLGTRRAPLKRLLKEALYRGFIPRFDAYLVVGKRTREYYSYYGADARRMFFAPHAVDNRRFAARAAELRPQRAALRKAWGLPENALTFLFAGKLVPRKRPHDFIQAIRQAARKGRPIWGLMVGAGPLRAELEAVVAQHRLPVRFTGFLNQSAMSQAYAAANALVLPSDGSETWGLVVNEAMASGLPAIVSDQVGCVPDLIHEGRTGYCYPCGDVAALAARCAELTTESLAVMGAQARVHIAGYSVEVAVEGMLAAIHNVTMQHKGSK